MLPPVYPLNVVLIGLRDDLTLQARRHLDGRQAVVEAVLPAVEEAAARYHQPNEAPRLFVVASSGGAEVVRRLRDQFDGWPILALAGPGNDPSAFLALNRAGADQVVALPLVEADFVAALDQIGRRTAPNTTDRVPQTVAVTGAVPGAGVSTVATGVAAEVACNHHAAVILFEAALQMGVLAINLDAKPTVTLADLLVSPDHLDVEQVRKALVPIGPGFQLLAAPSDVTRSGPNAGAAMLKALAVARELAPVVVADVPCTYDDLHFETLWAADQLVIVADQTLPSVRNCRMVLDAVARLRHPKRVHVVLNRYDPTLLGVTAARVAETLGIAAVRTVPADRAVMQAAADGRLLRRHDPHSPVLAAVADLARSILGPPLPAAGHSPSLFSRLLHVFSHEA